MLFMRCMRYRCHSMFFFVSSALVLLCLSYQLFHGLGSSVTLDIFGRRSCDVRDIDVVVCFFFFASSALANSFVRVYPCVQRFSL